MTTQTTQILTPIQLEQKIRRIAFEIYENNFEETELVLAGIAGEGYLLAGRLAHELRHISPLTITLLQITLDKKLPQQVAIHLDAAAAAYANKAVVVVDDVLNSGRTLAFSLQPFLSVPLRRLQVAVVVDRNHKRYPVSADYIGFELSTTLTEHVEVVLSDPERVGVYLQ
ncbi:phosphoribosyltransferase family protein [Tellurirhabdus bombi]|uniref:phosphoribosyltransferase family protein n=1 Tax=Tellurirhabdus bombi TaxID=2907205 RepID=UPI001F47A64C|nr:phosphoribosyltransferase family protein [Tellurirhabdus bombi]